MWVILDKGGVMNLNNIKKELKEKINCEVEIKVYGTRNKTETLRGCISNVYPNIFTLLVDGENRSFRYGDILTGDIKLKYL